MTENKPGAPVSQSLSAHPPGTRPPTRGRSNASGRTHLLQTPGPKKPILIAARVLGLRHLIWWSLWYVYSTMLLFSPQAAPNKAITNSLGFSGASAAVCTYPLLFDRSKWSPEGPFMSW